MSAEQDEMMVALSALTRRIAPGSTGAAAVRRLTGGANQEIWAFAAAVDGAEGTAAHFVLRRVPPSRARSAFGMTLDKEAEVVAAAGRAGAKVPGVRHILSKGDGLGEGYVMDYLEGETVGSRIARSDQFAGVRPQLAFQCGEAMARIHAIPLADLPPLPQKTARQQIDEAARLFRATGTPRPVFEYAVRWLEANRPEAEPVSLVHGDFRNGNIMVDSQGLRAVLDWEGAYLGDPMYDLGYICMNSWRFGQRSRPVGGFGSREQLYAGYEAGGLTVDRRRAHFWEVFGVLRWGVSCAISVDRFRHGGRQMERAMIARRASETEIDLLDLIDGEGAGHAG